MVNPIAQLGHRSIEWVRQLGNTASFAGRVALSALRPPLRVRSFIRELYKLGVLSLLVICLSGTAVGMVLGLQGYHTLARFGAVHSLGAVVGLSLIRELGPVLTALLVAGRAGSATTAEIGAMVATEQLDGLRMASIDPVHLILMPKALAMLAVMPLLSAIFIVCGLFGGYAADVAVMHGDPGSYMTSLRGSVNFENDVAGSLLKSGIFGALVSVIATHRGYTAAATSEGVSAATTSTVVTSSVTVLLCDYMITSLWGV
jgi:phospholipid/cholesterol/gamma-HCH transport system permease protein